MVAETPTWGAPRIHSELLMLGFDVAERTISRWLRRAPRAPEPAHRWLTFLRNHREAIAGTVRMGKNPKTSVLNSFCQAHEVKNLFVTDGSCFTACSEKNLTLTIVALSLRAADYIKEQRRKGEL